MVRMLRIAACLATLALLFSFAAAAQGKPILIGAALSQTGFLADLAAGTRDALLLWRDEVNAAGGLLGRPVDRREVEDRVILHFCEVFERVPATGAAAMNEGAL